MLGLANAITHGDRTCEACQGATVWPLATDGVKNMNKEYKQEAIDEAAYETFNC